jgi:hypothetical protein
MLPYSSRGLYWNYPENNSNKYLGETYNAATLSSFPISILPKAIELNLIPPTFNHGNHL